MRATTPIVFAIQVLLTGTAAVMIRWAGMPCRGPEIPVKKGNAYRIVALGASTTFGVTINASDLPWPRRLERLIEERLKPQRPVEVINAGVPGYRLDQELIQITETNHIRLALATFSMAANNLSDPDVVEFYQAGYPKAPWEVQANRVHSRIVRELAREYPDVCFVDTHPNLDGQHDKFIDLVHFSPAGKAQMAETFFAALKPILEKDLSRF